MRIHRRTLLGASLASLATIPLAGCARRRERLPGQIIFQGAYENHATEPIHTAMQRWAELLEERSDGQMVMDLYPSSQLGSKLDLIDQMLAGSPVITLADGAFYADQGVSDFGIMWAPFLFDTWDQCWTLIKSQWYADRCTDLENRGLKILTSNWKYGDRDTMLSTPIDSVEGLHGMKIRVPSNVMIIKGFEALGATPTPMALSDVYTSLQQGTIDGLENPVSVLANGKFQEVCKYLLLDSHIKNFTTWVTGAETIHNLSDEQAEILMTTGDEAGLYYNELQDADYDVALASMTDDGVQILDIDLDEFKAKAQSFYELPAIKQMFSPGLYETVKEAMS